MFNNTIFKYLKKRLIKPLTLKIDQYSLNHDHKIAAQKAIKAYEDSNGIKLSPNLKKLADEYASDVFGGKEFSPWLQFYSLVSGEFKEGWIPDNYFGEFVAPQKGLSLVSLYKTFANVLFKTPILPDIAYFIDGHLYNNEFGPTNVTNLRKTCFKEYPDVILKPDNSHKGRGIFKICSERIDEEVLKKIGDCVLQYPLKQHLFFDEIIPESDASACLRIFTVRNLKGEIEARTAHLNLGRKVENVFLFKNFFQVPIVSSEGELNSFGFTSDWKKWKKHPDTDNDFARKKIPHFSEANKVCIDLHSLIPHFNVVGWDIAITTDEEIKLMEWNAIYPGIKLDEAVRGPCFCGLNWENLWRNNRRR